MVVAFGIPGIAVPGILLFCPLRAVLRRTSAGTVSSLWPRYMPPLWACGGVISFAVGTVAKLDNQQISEFPLEMLQILLL